MQSPKKVGGDSCEPLSEGQQQQLLTTILKHGATHGAEGGAAHAADDEPGPEVEEEAAAPAAAYDPLALALVLGDGAGPSGSGGGDESEKMPPTMLPNIPGIEGLTKEEIALFMESLDEFTPTIPDGLTNHYLKMCGIKEPDVRITRLISLATQNFISQIAQDARQCSIQRFEMQTKDKRDRGYDTKDKRVVLTMDDLSAALKEYGRHLH